MQLARQSTGGGRFRVSDLQRVGRQSISRPGSDPTLVLDLQFARDQAYVSRRGPLPTFTRASVATRVNSAGLIVPAAIHETRIDYNPTTLACLGLLIEEQRSNLNAWSEDLTNAAWSKNNTAVTGNASIAPDGNSSADLLSETTANAAHYTIFSGIPVSVTIGITYTMSVFLKKGTGATAPDWINLFFVTTAFGAKGVAFNVSTGSVGATSGGQTATVKQFPNGWWRVSMTATATSSASQGTLYTSFTNNTNSISSPTYTGQTTSNVFVWGAQFEAGSFATSYVPTTTTSLIRSVDVCSITGAAFTGFYNQTEGAMVFKGDRVLGNNVAGISGFPRYISFDDGTVSNRIHLWWYAGPNNYMVTAVGVDSASINSTAVTDGSRFAMAARYKANDFAVSQNAGAVLTDTTGPVPTVDRAGIGMAGNSGGSINGHIHTIQYFNAIKTNAQLQALSTP